ncbi:YbaB/EbfC family DNA-binding protein [Longispora sp. K20-0274]|uniref:YbaB/EbfC family nucleoid-associated protein n=1 Tax=Longispora sp. K20-0274 TaxID=3088255 RepID=UPI00399C41CF
MPPEYDQAWTDEAIARFERIEARQAAYERAIRAVEVIVRSPDGNVEVTVAADGEVRAVSIDGQPRADILETLRSAGEAATWAREKVRAKELGDYQPLMPR